MPLLTGEIEMTARLATTRIQTGAHEEDIAVVITAPRGHATVRPPLSVAIVIDRSGSMSGVPIYHAKIAAKRLVDALGSDDAFSIITYSSSDEVVIPMTRASADAKDRATAAIDNISSDGGTCISCGLQQADSELKRTSIIGGLRRIMLISDGQANEGIYDRNELAQLASQIAMRGVSISTGGVGLDFDEVTMQRLADVGHGNYYFVENTETLDATFQRELGGLTETIAADVRLVVSDAPGVHVEEAYGYPLTREGSQVIVPIADLRAGETRKVVLRASVDAHTGPVAIALFQLGWRRIANGTAGATQVELSGLGTEDAREVAASADREAMQIIEAARSAHVLEEATITYQRDGYQAAQRVLEHHLDVVRANKNLEPATVQAIEAAEQSAANGFAAAPSGAAASKLLKKSRADAYKMAH